MPRLFTAIELPAEVRDGLGRLRAPLPGARWVDPGELHLTLRFAGDIDNRQAREFTDLLAAVSADAFPLRLAGTGAFGGNEPRTLWAGVEHSDALELLARANERAARSAGLPPEHRNFHAHVTLARLRHAPVDRVAKWLARTGGFAAHPFHVGRFVVLSSKPNTGGGPYVVEDTFPLSGDYGEGFDAEEGWA